MQNPNSPRDDYLQGRRISENLTSPLVFIFSSDLQKTGEISKLAMKHVPENASRIIRLSQRELEEIKDSYKEIAEQIPLIDQKPSFFDSEFKVPGGELVLHRNPYTLGESSYEILAIYV